MGLVDLWSLWWWCPPPASCLRVNSSTFDALFNNSVVTGSSCLDIWNLVIWLPAIISSLFSVSIDTSVGLVLPQKSSSSMGCTLRIPCTVRNELDDCTFVSDTWAPMLGVPLSGVDSSVVVVSSTCALAVLPVIQSLSSDFDWSPFLISFFASTLISGLVVRILCWQISTHCFDIVWISGTVSLRICQT